MPQRVQGYLQWIRYLGKRIPDHRLYASHVRGKKGIEIGGPSPVFKTTLPLYNAVEALDGVNFSSHTLWEGSIAAGRSFNYIGHKTGIQHISDATDLNQLGSATYDFLLSSNCLEHVANPLKALGEWKRVLRDGGALILVLPNKESNFDHKRPVTSFEHLLSDYTAGTTEHDLTHLTEILALHDLALDPPAGNFENFRARSLDNYSNRGLHHHVFDMPLICQMLEHSGFQVISTCVTKTDFFALSLKG